MRCRFLELPGELRNKIYGLAFEDTDEVTVPHGRVTPIKRQYGHREVRQLDSRAGESVAFLQTNSQTHAEASAYMYGKNVFTFNDDSLDPVAFASRIGSNRDLVARLRLDLYKTAKQPQVYDHREMLRLFNGLQRCQGLERFDFHFWWLAGDNGSTLDEADKVLGPLGTFLKITSTMELDNGKAIVVDGYYLAGEHRAGTRRLEGARV